MTFWNPVLRVKCKKNIYIGVNAIKFYRQNMKVTHTTINTTQLITQEHYMHYKKWIRSVHDFACKISF